MRRAVPPVLLALFLAMSPLAAQADWQAVETVKPYSVRGKTGIDLYRSIGERGPTASIGRAIAHTTFDLKWSRDYRPQPDGSCRLVSARPWLTIIYTLPEPAEELPAPVARLWKTFMEGIRSHEEVHGEHMRDMVDQILRTTVGLTVADDPDCRKIRQEINTPLGAASQEQRRRSREFDRIEMQNGGNVHRLILGLVNGE